MDPAEYAHVGLVSLPHRATRIHTANLRPDSLWKPSSGQHDERMHSGLYTISSSHKFVSCDIIVVNFDGGVLVQCRY